MPGYEYENDRRHGYSTAKRTVDPDCSHSPTPKKSIKDSLKMHSSSHFYVSYRSKEAHILCLPSFRSRCRGMQFWG